MPRTRSKAQRSEEATRLRRLRDVLGFTQRELAVEIKVAHGAIAAWESGKQTMPGPVLRLLELYEEELGIEGADEGLRELKTTMAARNLALSRTAGSAVVRASALAFERMLASETRRGAIARRANLALARRIVETLGELKGVAMKLGQTFGYLDFGVPEEIRAELASLQVLSRPMPPVAIAQVFLEEFGEPPRRLFAEWDPQPFAVASIGQVHRARLKSGEKVAVKVQYPRVAEAIDADLRSAALLDRFLGLLFRGQERGSLIAEMRERFTEECDYLHEAEHQEFFRRVFAGQPGIRVPRVYREMTRRRVLVSELIEGESLEAHAAHAAPAARAQLGMALWRFTIESILRHGVIHADAHPGNFLVANGDLVVLDFGCVKRLSAQQQIGWRTMVRAIAERRGDIVRHMLLEMRFAPRPEIYDFEAHHRMLVTLSEPWLSAPPFTFTPAYAERVWREAMIDNPNKFRVNLPREWLFMHRVQFGLWWMLTRLGGEANYRAPMIELLYGSREPHPQPFSAAELSWQQRAPAN